MIHTEKLVVTCDLVNLVHVEAIELYHDMTTNFTVWIIASLLSSLFYMQYTTTQVK